MAIKQVIATSKAPQPPNDLYSQGIVSNGMVYCSGSVGLDPDTGILVDGDIRARTVCASPAFTLHTLLLIEPLILASLPQEPHRSPGGGGIFTRECCKGEHLPNKHGGLRSNEQRIPSILA